jgi:hypothetical protein
MQICNQIPPTLETDHQIHTDGLMNIGDRISKKNVTIVFDKSKEFLSLIKSKRDNNIYNST